MQRFQSTPVAAALALASAAAGVVSPGTAEAQNEVKNGDINGSGAIDISDVIALASALFLGGPQPVPIVCPPPGECCLVEPPANLEGGYYGGLDLERAAKEQYGPTATVTSTGDHLYDWKARVGRDLEPLDVARAVEKQYGPDWTLVTTGVHKFDWKAFRISEPEYVVLPVMLLASDRFFDVAGVATAVRRFSSVLSRVQGWYNLRVEGTLRVLEPIVLSTNLTSSQWNTLSAMTSNEDDRYVLLDACISAYENQLPQPGAKLRIVLSIYTGESADVWLGAASTGGYAMAPPRATSLDCPLSGPLTPECADAAYAIGHELGHTFGLGHSCDEYPEYRHSCEVLPGHPCCDQSIMQVGRPPEAVLLQPEICILLDSPFFQALDNESGPGLPRPGGGPLLGDDR